MRPRPGSSRLLLRMGGMHGAEGQLSKNLSSPGQFGSATSSPSAAVTAEDTLRAAWRQHYITVGRVCGMALYQLRPISPFSVYLTREHHFSD